MLNIICSIVLIIWIICSIYSAFKNSKESVSTIIILKEMFIRGKRVILWLIVFCFLFYYRKDIEGSLLWVLVLLLGYIIFNGNNGNSKIKDYKMKNHFSIRIHVDIKELLRDSRLKDILDEVFKNKKELGGLSRKQVEKALLDNQEKHDYYKLLGEEGWNDFKFDILGDLVFFNGEPVLDGKIYGTIYIPYDKNEEVTGFSNICSGLTLRALVVNGLLKVQIGRMRGRGDVIETGEKDIDNKSIRLFENYIDIAIYPLEKYRYLYPLDANQYNASQQALEEDIKAGVYGNFYGKFMKNNKYLAEVEQARYITSVHNQSDDDYIISKVKEIEESNPLDYGEKNQYARIWIDASIDNWNTISSRYFSSSF